MLRKIIVWIMVMTMSVGVLVAGVPGAQKVTGTLNTVQLYISRQTNSENQTLQAYNIGGYNYFRVRDIFRALNIDVQGRSGEAGITVQSRKAYTSKVALPTLTKKNITVNLFEATVNYDGIMMKSSCFNLDGYNYFKLQDLSDASLAALENTLEIVQTAAKDNGTVPPLGSVLGFAVNYAEKTKLVSITKIEYDLDEVYTTAKTDANTIPENATYVADENDEIVVSVGGKSVRVGDSESSVLQTFGTPDRKEAGAQQCIWYVYNKNMDRYIMIAIANHQVVGYATTAQTFSVNNGDLDQGFPSNRAMEKKMTVLLDSNDSNLVRGIYYCEAPLDEKAIESGASFAAEERINADLVNGFRVSLGKKPLAFSESLATVARAHSQDMADKQYFDHTNLAGQSPFDRMTKAGLSYRMAGENIASVSSPLGVTAFDMWLNSAGHRDNMLTDGFTEIGVGIGRNGKGNFMYSQLFRQ